MGESEEIVTCCHIACGDRAEFEILTERRENGSGDGMMAGPDPYGDYTFACEAHVGALLGHQPTCPRPEEIYWTIIPFKV